MSAPAPASPRRESVTTIQSDGSRPFIFPGDARGRFNRARMVSGYLLIAVYLLLPWIQINGHPAVFLDVAARRFHLFGFTLGAQDLWLLFFLITGLGFTLFFVTALFGRIWCGWACPQTVFLDQVYRRIERWIDGDSIRRRVLHDAPLSLMKAAKRVLKHALYILVSVVITHLFLAYFVSLPEVWQMVSASPVEHWGAFLFILTASGLIYFNYAWFREQLCIVICPYGRIQSALIDDHSLVIGYDVGRGEPRGKPRPFDAAAYVESLEKPGDCVACNRCVQVCPTGIDIRHGLQMECIGCTACIDACDEVMTRLHRPRGLIRYDSQVAFTGERTRWLRPRTLLYAALLLVGASVAGWALLSVKPADFAITRMTGAPYIVEETAVRNQFLLRIVNKRNEPADFRIEMVGTPAGLRALGVDDVVQIDGMREEVLPLIIQQPRDGYTGPFHFEVRISGDDGDFQLTRGVEFLGPEARLLQEKESRP